MKSKKINFTKTMKNNKMKNTKKYIRCIMKCWHW